MQAADKRANIAAHRRYPTTVLSSSREKRFNNEPARSKVRKTDRSETTHLVFAQPRASLRPDVPREHDLWRGSWLRHSVPEPARSAGIYDSSSLRLEESSRIQFAQFDNLAKYSLFSLLLFRLSLLGQNRFEHGFFQVGFEVATRGIDEGIRRARFNFGVFLRHTVFGRVVA